MSESAQTDVMRRVGESLERIAQPPSPLGPDMDLTNNGRTLLAGAAVGLRVSITEDAEPQH